MAHDGQGAALARQLHGLVKVNFAGLGLAEESSCVGRPKGVPAGHDCGGTDGGRKGVAQKVNANVLIYGVITESGDEVSFVPSST